jgi:hypothetical protein
MMVDGGGKGDDVDRDGSGGGNGDEVDSDGGGGGNGGDEGGFESASALVMNEFVFIFFIIGRFLFGILDAYFLQIIISRIPPPPKKFFLPVCDRHLVNPKIKNK